MRRTALTALVALMVVLAGCGATTQGSPTTTATQTDDSAIEPTSGSHDGPTGTLAFYVSDEPAAIDDFEHLNVTITEIGLKPKATEGEDESEAEGSDEEENETSEMVSTVASEDDPDDSTGNASTVTSTVTTTNESDTTENSSSTTTPTATTTTVTTADEPEAESEEAEGEASDGEKSDWVTYDVDSRTVDLTELRGANATRLANLEAPSGEYTTVFVHVSEVTGTLKNGETVTVKLPSQKLKLNSQFSLGPDTETEFVYDIAVHTAGNSGKYILKPNIGESGTEVEIEDVAKTGDDDEQEEHEEDESPEASESMDENQTVEMDDEENATAEGTDNEENESAEHGQDGSEGEDAEGESALRVEVLGNVTAGGSVTISVTDADGAGVAGATVTANGVEIGTTGPDGEIDYTIPSDAEELEISVTKGQQEGESERAIESET